MKDFESKSLAIFGRLPSLSVAELERLYGAEHIKPIAGAALLDIDAFEIGFKRLGGTVKLSRVLTVLPTTKWQDLEKFLVQNIPQHLQNVPEGTFTLGVSLYGLNVPVPAINRSLMALKKVIRKTGRSIRVVPNKTPDLNSAQVLHNKLTTKGAWELILMRDGMQTILAQTVFVQDIDAYAARDHARPKRDARVGMLPPKLAQTMINVATGPVKPDPKFTLLDPFCGTGVVLQEALLMGFSVIGTDKEPRMVEYSRINIDWLRQKYPNITGEALIEVADATNHKWTKIDAIATETYLGRPFSHFPAPDVLREVVQDVNTIHRKFLANLAPQLEKGKTLCLAVPAWRKPSGELIHLPVIDHLTDMGYNYLDLKHVARSELIYYREDQTVARQLLALVKT